MKQKIKIVTDRLIIEDFSEDCLTDEYVSWLNNEQVVKYSRQRHKQHSLSECVEYFDAIRDTDHFFLAIKEASSHHIGNITITRDIYNNHSDIAIIIGNSSCWGRGYGYEAWHSVCQFLINEMRVYKVMGGCYSNNLAMKRIMEKANMNSDGVRKNHVLYNGEYIDILHYSLFNEVMNDGR